MTLSGQRRFWGLALVGAMAGVALAPAPAGAAAVSPGIVVTEVRAGTAGEKAGLLPDDVLVSWRRDPLPAGALPAGGELGLPFDLEEVLLEQMPRARVTLQGRRGTEERSWVLPPGAPARAHGLRTAPLLPEDLRALDRQGRAQLATDKYEAGIATLRSAAERARSRGAEGLAVWLLLEGARELEQGRHLEEAHALYSAAASSAAKLSEPGMTAQIYREWGDFSHRRFAWDRARECYQRALEADRRKGFDALGAAWSLEGIGMIDIRTRRIPEGEALYEEAIEIRQRLAPGSAEPATGWLRRAHALGRIGEWGPAAERYRKALELLPDDGVSPLLRAEALANLALMQEAKGESEASRQSLQRAHALVQAAAPEDFLMVGITQTLGMRAAAQGELARAEELLSQSLALFRQHRPGGLDEAEALRELGLLQMRQGKQEAGSLHLCEARDVVNAWWRKLRTDQDLRHWWSRFAAKYYRECAAALAELKRGEDAFAAVEEGRARAFLDLRAERGVRLSSLSPERGREWRDLNAEHARVQEELRAANARGGLALEQRIHLESRLREIRRQKGRLLERDLPPGAVRYPEPLTLAAARRPLEKGTALLLYSVAETRTLLFILLPEGASPQPGGPGWTVLPLDLGGEELGKRVGRFRDTLLKQRFNRPAVEAQASVLYELLVAPAEPYLAGAERIVIAPDGPLHTLPFAALRRGDRYLVEWKPLHFTLSATVYAQQLASRKAAGASGAPGPGPERLVAFGDPRYLPAPAGQDPSRSLLGDGVPPLPATRQEVEGIARLFPGARTLLGEQVTEEAVREAVPGATLVHFAVHGLFNPDSPLDSALVLSPSRKPGEGGRNGLIETWEVMENLSLDADLVTLSACDTALGREVGGEGLVGLTRAFHYAGARSVIATLWGVSDRSTAGFMTELYGALKEGRTKDEALRAAQLAQIRSDKPQPFYWAAFQLFGDWR